MTWKMLDPMGGLMGSGRFRPRDPQRPEIPPEMLPTPGAAETRPTVPQPLPPEPPPAPKVERALRRVPPAAPVEAVPVATKPLGMRGAPLRAVPPVVVLRPAPSGIQPGTIRGTILRAACELAAGSTLTRIALADVVVRAWRLDTARLGLRGYEQLHPDANRVYAKLSGTEGLVELGLLERTGFGVVSVTRKGLAWWRRVSP